MRLRPETALTFDDVLLVPRRSSIRSRQAVDTNTRLSRRIGLALPIIAANMDTVTEAPMAIALARLGGLGVIHRFMSVERQAAEVARVKQADLDTTSTSPTTDERGRLRVGVAVGVRGSDLARAEACVAAGADLLVVDIAHGHSDSAIDVIRRLKQAFPAVDVVGGNVATAEGVRDLAEAGADGVKVGVGAGSICITRVVTGFGIPQLSAIAECAEAGQALDVPIIADGGIRNSGDITKALAAGASSVMLGSLLAGTDESPGASVVRKGMRYKIVRGMASLTANIDRQEVELHREVDPEDWERVVPEGVEALVPARGPVRDIVFQLVGGLRSGLSYAGAATISELWASAEFVRVTGAGRAESGAHDVDVQ
jgi:guanosine monophosphate reductase